jgi:hypothetical protein
MANMLSRTAILFKEFGIDNWCLGNTTEDISHVFFKDYSASTDILEKERARAFDYLKGALKTDET